MCERNCNSNHYLAVIDKTCKTSALRPHARHRGAGILASRQPDPTRRGIISNMNPGWVHLPAHVYLPVVLANSQEH